jgi:GDPmannose 4,6-dehydratase
MAKTALITGIFGQDGAYLAHLLLLKGYNVFGLGRRSSIPKADNLIYLGIDQEVNTIYADMSDMSSLISAILISKPDEIYNLAAQSFVGASWNIPVETSMINAIGTLNLLEAIRKINKSVKFYQASTSELFGSSEPLQNEDTPFHPRSPYGVSKLFAHNMVINYRESFEMFNCNGILFNHESPLRGVEFVTRKISQTVAGIKKGYLNELRLGNIDVKRDWGFAGDYVRAMWLMLQQSLPDDYVIATGESHTVREFVEIAFNHVDLDYNKYVVIDPKLFRPAEINFLQGDAKKASLKLGWLPVITFEKLVKMMVDADLEKL